MSNTDWTATKHRAWLRHHLVANGWSLTGVDQGGDYWGSPVETWRKPGERFAAVLLVGRHDTGLYAQTTHPVRGGEFSTSIAPRQWAELVSGSEALDEVYMDLVGVYQ